VLECVAQSKGGNTACSPFSADLRTWTLQPVVLSMMPVERMQFTTPDITVISHQHPKLKTKLEPAHAAVAGTAASICTHIFKAEAEQAHVLCICPTDLQEGYPWYACIRRNSCKAKQDKTKSSSPALSSPQLFYK
jgi:hypothetical protein